jgi:D-alanyl-D-alanine carboxypeptidase
VLPRPLHRTLGAMAPVLALAVALPLVVASTASARFRPEIFAAIVIDADSGEVLYDNQSQAVLYPASLTKMMTLYLVFENLDKKRLRLDEDIAISATAASREPAKLGLPAGAVLPLEDAILALTTKSANDIATALAERLAGTEPNFAMVMQAKAHELGMEDTQFRNASGLPDGEHYSSARDMATLARALIRDYPQYYHYFSARSFQFQGIDYANQNRLLGNYPGADGIKTGYIKASGHNLAASAVRDGKRLIGVVFGGPTLNWTRQRMTELLDEAFGAPSQRPTIMAAAAAAREVIPAVPDTMQATEPAADPRRSVMPGDSIEQIEAVERTETRLPPVLPGDSMESLLAAAPGRTDILPGDELPASPEPTRRAPAVLPGDPIDSMPTSTDIAATEARSTRASEAILTVPQRLSLIGKKATPVALDTPRLDVVPAQAEAADPRRRLVFDAPSAEAPATSPAPASTRPVQRTVSAAPGTAPVPARKRPTPAPSPTGSADWSIHLGTWPDRASAERGTQRAVDRMPRELHPLTADLVEQQDSGRVIARVIRLTRAEAKAACGELERFSVPCIVVPPGRPLVVATR